jgi:hypothetical protein
MEQDEISLSPAALSEDLSPNIKTRKIAYIRLIKVSRLKRRSESSG